jgi:pteridine reductase
MNRPILTQHPMATTKVAVVTGSGKKRVGWYVADALAARGYAVAVHYRTSATDAAAAALQFQSRGVPAQAFQADLTQEAEVKSLIAAVLARFGRIDVLVNTAATWKPHRLEEATAADVLHYFEANTLSTFLCCQHAGLAMVQQPEGGTIVNVGDWAIVRPYLNYAAYFPSKGAIPALTRSFAVELGTRNPNIRVNCVLPGPVMLPPELPAKERQAAIDATLVKREGRPENVAQAVVHFVENDFLTGVCLPVDGGRSTWAGT